MKKRAKPHPDSHFHVLCPFCGFACTRDTPMTWCSGCFVEYYITARGAVMFDTQRRTDRFIWAKALQKAGGVRFGEIKPPG